MPNPQPSRLRRTDGFALLVTITLLAFVVLLLVGLATYTRVETAISGNTQKQTQARQNALLALDVALAQLQKHAGPDTRVTASAGSFGGIAGTRYYTGVWDNAHPDAVPVWLASGLETGPVTLAPAPVAAQRAELVGVNTAGTGNANNVVARLIPITTVGVPGQSASATIGRYAWWIGDQGVKAAVGLGDRSAAVDYAPWSENSATDLRDRIRQQISLGAGATNAAGAGFFEPRSSPNIAVAANTVASTQLAFFNTGATTTAKVGIAAAQLNYHVWAANNFGVLADTAGSGLRRDLSIDPSLLGSEAQAWLDYPSYMESPGDAAASTFPPLPEISNISLRRRFQIRASGPRISPILTFFYLTLGVSKPSQSAPYAVSLRWGATLWNPYSSALVPENLKLEISGLPSALTVFAVDPVTQQQNDDTTLPLAQLYGTPLTVTLPWTRSALDQADERSWLPGRIHNWVGGSTRLGTFNVRDIPAFSSGLLVSFPGGSSVNGNTVIGLRLGEPTTLVINVTRENGEILATYTSPTYNAVPASMTSPASNTPQQLVFPFRLQESFDDPGMPSVWVSSAGRDPRNFTVPSSWLLATPNGTDPSTYQSFIIVSPGRLLDRVPSSHTYNEDVPVFELPRAPLLSVGALQHLALPDTRSFFIGNSWGASTPINGLPSAQLFDQFFFSGLTPAATPTGSGSTIVLPNPLLRVNPRTAGGTTTQTADLRAAADARSSKYLLQAGAFNVNSTGANAWTAVLRSVRFDASNFNFVDADPNTGTATTSDEKNSAPVHSSDAQFFRFSQSAQETYKAEPGLAAGSSSTPSTANTHLFRKGMITLAPAQVLALGTQIATLVGARASAKGPFRSVAEFLSPSADYTDAGGQQISLLEKAIADSAINVDAAGNPIEFSSQFLTQGDIMTALAPVLFARSDTFIVRTYGEAVNPTTGVAEGKAWCEATVQRTPEYFDPADDATVAPADVNATNQIYGRRFKVVSFRWLTRSDI